MKCQVITKKDVYLQIKVEYWKKINSKLTDNMIFQEISTFYTQKNGGYI